MKKHLSPRSPLTLAALTVLISVLAFGQTPQTPAQPSAAPGVPRLVKFSGLLKDASGNLLTNTVGIMFSIYSEQTSGVPLWQETQNVQFVQGRYTVFLGETTSAGIPAELFASGEPRWLGVKPLLPGEEEQPRVLLASVPYALKAVDADTLGGLPASAFLQANGGNSNSVVVAPATAAESGKDGVKRPSSPVTTSGGTVGYIPYFYGSTDIENSAIFQLGTGASAMIGIGTTKPTSTVDVVETGTFTGTSYECYLCSNIGGFSFGSSIFNSTLHDFDAVAGGVVIPTGAVFNYNAEGSAGYCVTNADSRPYNAMTKTYSGNPGHDSNCVGFFGAAQSNVSNGGIWGINTTTSDTAGTSNNFMIGYEDDIWVQENPAPYTVFGMQITLNGSGVVPSSASYAINIEPSANTNSSNKWGEGVEISDACCGTAMQVGASANISGTPAGSQPINFAYWSGTARGTANLISADSTGDLVLGASNVGAVTLPQFSFGNLPSISNGSILFCVNCKNVVDDGVTAGGVCATGGHGAVAKRENSRWDCN